MTQCANRLSKLRSEFLFFKFINLRVTKSQSRECNRNY